MRNLTLIDHFNQDACCYCLTETPAAMTDALGVPWCAEHRFRGQLLSWGMAHNFPAIEALPFAVAHGAWHWYTTATLGSEECLWTLIVAIEALYDEEIAA